MSRPPARIVIGNFSDLKHKINNKWPNVLMDIDKKMWDKFDVAGTLGRLKLCNATIANY